MIFAVYFSPQFGDFWNFVPLCSGGHIGQFDLFPGAFALGRMLIFPSFVCSQAAEAPSERVEDGVKTYDQQFHDC